MRPFLFLEQGPLGDIDLADWSGIVLGGGPFNVSDPRSPGCRRVRCCWFSTDTCPVHAFRLGRHADATQFHPELELHPGPRDLHWRA